MIQSANNYSLSVLFLPDQNFKYTIPKYQREYVWQQRNWEALFDDINENEKGHFLGSIICINQSTDIHQTLRLELVDGQQRITTTSLLYAAIYHWLKENAGDDDDDVMVELVNIRNRLVQKQDRTLMRLEPSLQGRNYDDYEWVLANARLLNKEVSKPQNAGKRRIDRAFQYFLWRLSQEDSDRQPLFTVDNVIAFLDRLNSASMVKIEVNSHSDAFTLFETLNNRGEPLSALDLIKNKFLDFLDQKQISTIEQNFELWTKLLDNLTNDPRIQQRYLRHYYNSFKYKPDVRVQSISKATRSNLIDIYGKLIDRDVQLIFKDLYAKSKLYSRLARPENDHNHADTTKALISLDRIGGVTSLGFLLYLLAEYPAMDPNALTAIVNTLIVFFVRRNITDTPPTRDLDKMFIDMIEHYQQTTEQPTAVSTRIFLQQPGWYVTDEAFRSKLEGNIYYDNTDAARFILCTLEEQHQTRETRTDLWERYPMGGQFIRTIEHVFPQGKNLPPAWVNMIAGGDANKAKLLQDQYVHKLGNLTLSGYNTELGNKAFDQKRDRKDNKGHHVGYKNGLYLNRQLAEKEQWTVEDIQARTDELVTHCMPLFAMKMNCE